jgi:DedD protein
MEKKKLLIVAVSLGVVLVILIGGAILLFRPGTGFNSEASNNPGNSRLTSGNSTGNESLEYQNPPAAPPVQENHITNNDSSDLILDGNGDTSQTKINIPKPSTAAVPDVKPAAKPKETRPASAPEKSASAPKKAYKDYWVQAGSYSTRDRADGVKTSLSTKGISAIVSNQEINGSTFYRVRIGPCTSQNEADYWLAMVKSIDGFQDSQIWESQSVR